MATLFKPMDVQVDGNGLSMPGAKLYFYTTGTSTPQDTFSADDLDPGNVNSNPVVADANGLWPAIYLGTTDYKVILKTSADVTLLTLDPVLVNPAATPLSDQIDAQFGSTEGSLLERSSSAWTAVTFKAVLDRKFGTGQYGFPIRGASDWQTGALQVRSSLTGAVATGTTTLPADNTIPQSGEGDQYLSLAITPKSASSLLVIEAHLLLATGNGSDVMSVALFQDSTADALKATAAQTHGADLVVAIAIRHVMTSGTTSATTFKVRAGTNSAGTTTFNGAAGTRLFGGVAASGITIIELPAP